MRFHERLALVAAALSLTLALAAPSTAAWPTDPALNLPIADRPGEQVVPKIAVAPDGRTYVAWFDNAAGSYDVYLQHLDAAGNEVWPHNGVLVSSHAQSSSLVDWDLIVDSQGNAVVTFTDTRDGGDLDVFAYRIDAAGTFLWGANGVQLSFNSDYEPSPVVCEASDGDFVFVWPWLPNGDGALRMQRLSPAGAPRFVAGGVNIVSAPGESPAFCQIVASDDASVLVSYVRDIDTFAAPRHVRMVRVSSMGSIVWGPLAVFDQASVPIAHLPQMQSDLSGGAVIWWHRSIANVFNSCVQHVSSAGAELWGHNGVTVSGLAGRYHINPTCTFDPESGATYCFWNEETTNQNQWGIRGQRLLADGTRNWGSDGIAFVAMSATFRSPPRTARPGYAVAPAVPTVVYAEQPTGTFGDERVHAFCPDIDGTTDWGPINVATTLSTKSRLPLTVDVSGTVRVIWEDDRNGTPDVYGQAIRIDGTLGSTTTDAPELTDELLPISPANLSAWPNPFQSSTRIAVPSSASSLEITDATGRLVRRLSVRSGELSVDWDGRDENSAIVAHGVYFARATNIHGIPPELGVRVTRVR